MTFSTYEEAFKFGSNYQFPEWAHSWQVVPTDSGEYIVMQSTGEKSSYKFSVSHYPYQWNPPCHHEWVQTGTRRTWCSKCNAEGHWDTVSCTYMEGT